MPDGTTNKCKECSKKQVKERNEKLKEDPEWVEKEKVRAREKYRRLGYNKYKPSKEDKSTSTILYRERYPEKLLATRAAKNLFREDGKELHHWSYNKQHFKDVIELSIQEHAFLHRYIIYDQERKMYRTLEGVLLDTKEGHIEYFNQLLKTKSL